MYWKRVWSLIQYVRVFQQDDFLEYLDGYTPVNGNSVVSLYI